MSHETILIVEHEHEQRRLLARQLQEAGYHVLEAASGEEAVSLARTHHPAAVLLELILPGLDGWGIARELKADPITCRTPIVIVSLLRREGQSAPCEIVDYVAKPYSSERLLAAVRRAVWAWRSHIPLRILIADDEAEIIDILETVFRHEGFVTIRAKNGEEALDLTRREHPDLVILDVAMPHMDGWQTLRELKLDDRLHAIPVVMLTGAARSPQDAQTALAMGAARFVTKPFAPDAIVSEVTSVLQTN